MEETMIAYRNEYLISDTMIPTRSHQAYEELLQFQKEYASMIYFQKDRDGRIP